MKWKLIKKSDGSKAGIVDEKQKQITETHPHTKGKYTYEPIKEPAKPAGVNKKATKDK